MNSDLTLIESIILGIVQGITEFFPVSSDGHLVLGQHLLDFKKDTLVFDVLLHVGTLGALIVVFKSEVKKLLSLTLALLKNPRSVPKEDFKWWLYIATVTFVTGILGLALEKPISQTFTDVRFAGWGFLITSTFLFIAWYRSNGKKSPLDFSLWLPLAIGLAQASALLPGVSRSGMTIATALIFGINKNHAARFSFTAGIPIIFFAALYEMKHLFTHSIEHIGVMFVGVVTSFVVGLIAIRLLLAILTRRSLLPFAIYTLLLGLWVILYL